MRLKRTVADMEVMPRFYGVAWRLEYAMLYVCLPVPLNVIAGFVRRIYFQVVGFYRPDRFDAAWKAGYAAGRREGYDQGMIDLIADLRRKS